MSVGTTAPSAPLAASVQFADLPPGTRPRRQYIDAQGRWRRSAIDVPVDEFGRLLGTQWKCPKCVVPQWKPLTMKAPPVCPVHPRRMVPVGLKRPPMLPYRALWEAVERPLRPVWALPGMAAAGVVVDATNIPTLAAAGLIPVAGEVARRVSRRQKVRRHIRHGNLDGDDPHHGKRLRTAIDTAARQVGYTAASAGAWLTMAAGTGLDVSSVGGKVTWTLLPAVWIGPAASYWRKLRDRPAPTVVVAEPAPEGPAADPDELYVRRIWSTVLAVRAGDIIGHASDGVSAVKATQNGKLAGTKLEGWHRVTGGWGATIVGPIGAYESEQFTASVGKIASAFSVKKSMVTVIPDTDDENRSLVMIQRSSPIKDTVRWAGPNSIDVRKGVAPVAVYADGSPVMYELYRPGWGVPHVAAFGTTGSGKSEFINTLFTIDRWAHYTNADGQRVGIVADFLIDPQQGQSFAPFLDDLAAPVACSLNEALMLVEALTEEMLRRNRYLARVEYTDERGRKRRGRKWWNPLVDGPILALTIDEAHDYLSDRRFSAVVTKAGRMWRKCGGQLRIATHTPLLTDLGGSMALRDMLTGGFVFVGRTANSLSAPTAFNGRLPVDPRTIPQIPGMAYILTGLEPKAMLARAMWEPDYYDWVRDDNDQPIGYPAVLPPETVAAFGSDYARWVAAAGDGGQVWTPTQGAGTAGSGRPSPTNAVLAAMWAWPSGDMDMNDLVHAMQASNVPVGTLDIREAVKELRADGLVWSRDGRHGLTDHGHEALAEKLGEARRGDS